MRTVAPHFGVPGTEVGVGDLTCHVENENACMCAVIVGRMQAIEALLSCCVPDIDLEVLPIQCSVVSVHGQCVGGELALDVVIAEKTLHQLALPHS